MFQIWWWFVIEMKTSCGSVLSLRPYSRFLIPFATSRSIKSRKPIAQSYFARPNCGSWVLHRFNLKKIFTLLSQLLESIISHVWRSCYYVENFNGWSSPLISTTWTRFLNSYCAVDYLTPRSEIRPLAYYRNLIGTKARFFGGALK